jgi:hypothetical protein
MCICKFMRYVVILYVFDERPGLISSIAHFGSRSCCPQWVFGRGAVRASVCDDFGADAVFDGGV